MTEEAGMVAAAAAGIALGIALAADISRVAVRAAARVVPGAAMVAGSGGIGVLAVDVGNDVANQHAAGFSPAVFSNSSNENAIP